MTENLGSLHRGLASGGAVRFLAVEARALARQITERHDLGPGEARLAAECTVAALFLSAYLDEGPLDERLTLQVQGETPHFAFMADVSAVGGVRARFSPGRLGVHPFPERISGAMLAIKSNRHGELYRGVTMLEDQTIQEAFAHHLRTSAQVDVVVRVGATLTEGRVGAAGGMLVERLPEEVEAPSLDHASFAERYGSLSQRPIADLLVELAFGKVGLVEGDTISLTENREVYWACSCGQERIETVLSMLQVDDLREMLEEDGGAEVTCHFCNVSYFVDGEGLALLIDRKLGAQGH